MNRHGAVELDFGDGTFTFRLGLPQIEEIEEKTKCSIFTLARRLAPAVREPMLKDISETIRCGLIGGGMKPVDALAKVRRYVDERPLDESRDVAYAVVLAGLSRVHSAEIEREAEPPGEAPAPSSNVSTSAPSEQVSPSQVSVSTAAPTESGLPS